MINPEKIIKEEGYYHNGIKNMKIMVKMEKDMDYKKHGILMDNYGFNKIIKMENCMVF